MAQPKRTDVFICYSHHDSVFNDRITEELNPDLKRLGVNVWSDRRIPPGTKWYPEIDAALNRAKVAVLLVSLKFHNSSFIQEEELPRILRAQRDGLTIIPVKITEAAFEDPRIMELQAAWWNQALDQLAPVKRTAPVIEICKKILKALAMPPIPPPAEPLEIATLDIQVEIRRDSEAQGKDELLQSSTEARFIAMTYKSLRLALTQGHIRLPNLKVLELGVYALPVLREWHPILHEPADIENEWCLGLVAVLKAITRPGYAPNLTMVDIRIINRAPGFTASQLKGLYKDQSIVRIRHTQIQGQKELVDSETLVVARNDSEDKSPNPVFNYFAKAFDNTRAVDRSMLFPVMRSGSPPYLRKDIDGFVNSLRSVTNLKQYALPDKIFTVSIKVDRATMESARVPLRESGSSIKPGEVYAIFDYLRSEGRSGEFRLDSTDFSVARIVLGAGAGDSSQIELAIAGSHIVGVFGLLVDERRKDRPVFIKDKPKPAWTHDVPGGRVAVDDKSYVETLARELFEELGLPIHEAHIGELEAVKYDPKGKLANAPVIALYLRYRLDRDEKAYLEEILPNATDGFPVVAYPVTQLVSEKTERRRSRSLFPYPGELVTDTGKIYLKDYAEAVCHAPLEAMLSLLSK